MISHPATESDLRAVARLVAEIHGAVDSGAALLDRLGGPATAFAARPFRSGSVRGEWVATPGSSDDGALLYLHSRRFQFDEPAGVYAARLAAATGLPVLHLHYRLAPENPYPAALDQASERSRNLPETLANHLSKSVEDIAGLVNEASTDPQLKPASRLELAVTRPPALPMVYYRSGSVTPELTAMGETLARRLKTLAGSDTGTVDLRAQARAKFVAVVLGVGGTPEVTISQAADGILERLRRALSGGRTDDTAPALAETWQGISEDTFWTSLASGTYLSAELTGSRIDHLAWMGLVCELSPMTADFGWDQPSDKQLWVDRLIAAAGDEHDVSAVYAYASGMARHESLPRAVIAELVQLALANLPEVKVDQSSRFLVLNDETPEPDFLSMPVRDREIPRKLYSAKETLRKNALPLRTKSVGISVQEQRRPVRAAAFRYALGELWAASVEGIRAALGRGDDAEAAKARFDKVIANSPLAELLQTWSTGVAATSPDLTLLARTSTALAREIARLSDALAQQYPNALETPTESGLEQFLTDIANEVSGESADLLSDHPVGVHPLDGVRFEVSTFRSGASLLLQARLAVERRSSIATVVNSRISEAAKLVKGKLGGGKLAEQAWLQAVADKAGLVQAALNDGDANGLIQAAGELVDATTFARASAAALLRDQPAPYNAIERILDATSLSLCEQIDAFLDAADVDVLQSTLPSSLGALRRAVDGLDNKVFTGKFSAALSAWAKEAGRTTPDRDNLLTLTWGVVTILRAYRVGIDNTVTDPAARASLHYLLGQISATIDTRLAELDGLAPPPM